MLHRSTLRRLLAAVAASLLAVGTAALPAAARPASGTASSTVTPAAVTPPSSVVSLLKPQHPRLLASAADFTAVMNRVTSDQRTAAWYDKVKRDADDILTKPVSTYNPDPDLLNTAREVKRRIYTLALVYKISGNATYLTRAADELLAVAQFQDWNPNHFLDVGEMTNAVAIGYDWLYNDLTAAQRTTIRNGIKTNGLDEALQDYKDGMGWFAEDPGGNWNLVANAVALGALAIGDEEPTVSDDVLKRSITSIQLGIKQYHPDGGWSEGPAYWDYATEYLVDYLAAFNTAVGQDFGLSGLPGVAQAGNFAEYVTGPLGEPFNAQKFNFGDSMPTWDNVVVNNWQTFPMMWLAKFFNRPDLGQWEAKQADAYASPMDIVWYNPSWAGSVAHPSATDAYFSGAEVASARSSWDDPYATWVATKGLHAGTAGVAGHEDLDAGDVMLDALGVRWLENLGLDSYSLDGYFDWDKTTGGRWDYYNTRAEGQNTFQLGTGPAPLTALDNGAKITKVTSAPQQWSTITDLATMYPGLATRAERGVELYVDRHQVLVQDEIQTTSATDYRSFLHTRASISLADDGRSTTLSLGGQRLWIQLLGAPGAQLETGSPVPLPASPHPPGQDQHAGVRTLMVHLAGTTSATVALRMVPLAPGEQQPTDTLALTPLDQWTAATSTPAALTGINVGGQPLTGFDPHVYTYDVTLPWNTASPPSVAAVGGSATVTQASGLPGTAVLVLSSGSPRYRVHFHVPGKSAKAWPVSSVSASANDGNPPAHAVDDNLSTRWSASGNGQTLTLDLGTTRTVGGLSVAFDTGDWRAFNFDVLTSTDGSNWTAARSAAQSSGRTIDLEAYGLPTAQARYVRIVGHGNSKDTANNVSEVHVYSSSTDARSELPPRQQVPTGDAWVRDGSYSGTNYGSDPQLWVQNNIGGNTGDERITYVTYDLTWLSPATVTKAVFHLYGGITDGSPSAANAAYGVATPFTESTLTWSNRPALGSLLGTINTTNAAAWHALDITSYVQGQLAGSGKVTFGIVSNAAATGPHQAFNSKEAWDNHPYLEMNVS